MDPLTAAVLVVAGLGVAVGAVVLGMRVGARQATAWQAFADSHQLRTQGLDDPFATWLLEGAFRGRQLQIVCTTRGAGSQSPHRETTARLLQGATVCAEVSVDGRPTSAEALQALVDRLIQQEGRAARDTPS